MTDRSWGYQQLIGQEKAKNIVSRALVAGRIPHAFLFRGPEGVGKQLFARGLAAVVNCRNRKELSACGECSSCKKYLSANHPDFSVIQPEKGTIKIASIRELCKSLSYPPYESNMRVVLLEDVHTMRQEAANALLKTLEEPPEQNLLILTADTSKEVLATIMSRCQVVPFYPLSMDETCGILEQNLTEVDPDQARLLARLSEGSPGKAILFHEAAFLELLPKVIALLSDAESQQPEKTGQVLKLAEEMAGLKEDLPPFFGLLRLWYRDLLLIENGQQELLEKNTIFHAANKDGQKHWSSAELFAKLQSLDKADKELARNCNRALVCEVLLFSLQ